ncbi:MAG: J domain-containing protein, partial [Bdellovibrionota bacterium]
RSAAQNILGVSDLSTPDEINAAWKRMVVGNHPDRYTDPAAKDRAEKMSGLINTARDVLLNK